MTNNDSDRKPFSSVTFELSSSATKTPGHVTSDIVNEVADKSIVAIVASENINYELYLFRLLPLIQEDIGEFVYVTSSDWLRSLYLSSTKASVVSKVNDVEGCVSVVQSRELVTKYGCEVLISNNSLVTFEADAELSREFYEKWLSDLPQPYIGLSWDIRENDTSDNVGVSKTLIDIIEVLKHITGTLIIVQNQVSTEELEFIGQQIDVPILDCSDLNADPEEMFVMVSVLDDLIAVPDLALNFRSSLNKNAKLLWQNKLANISFWDSIREGFYDQYTVYSETRNGWEESLTQLSTDCKSHFYPNSRLPSNHDSAITSTNTSTSTSTNTSTSINTNTNTNNNRTANINSESRLNKTLDTPVKKTETPPKKIQGQDVESLINYATDLITSELSAESELHIIKMIEMFDTARERSETGLNVFVYHTNMGSAGQLQYKDVGLDLNKYDYQFILQVFILAVKRWRADATIYLVTSNDSVLFDFAGDGVKVIGLDVDPATPMFERVNAMCAYVHSKAFSADTLFLDSDAFMNAQFDNILNGDFDVAITTRPNSGLMPVNEGVIIGKYAGKERVQAFFTQYVSTYERLLNDETVQSYYGDIRKWRGGQLTLNVITHQASPYTPYHVLTLDGVSVRVLPCDPFNYSWEYGQSLSVDELKGKYIIHVKGGRKEGLKQISEIIKNFLPDRPKATGFVAPHFAVFNKMYNEAPFENRDMVQKFVGHLGTSADMIKTNQPGSGAHLSDDMFVWFRNLGFLEETDFVNAFSPYATDPLLRARIWRVYMLCWAAKSCMKVEGDFVDLGCYDGRTVHVITRYIDFNKINKRYFLYDLFENPTDESRKAKHGAGLHSEVEALFSDYSKIDVIKGPVPDSFGLSGEKNNLQEKRLPEKIAFAQIDLNEANAEMAALEVIYDRVTPGGIIIFDDFGFKRYADSHHRESDYFRERGDIVFESPTGQGLFIKRG